MISMLGSPRSVADILDKQEYLGHTMNFKAIKKSFKIKKKINNVLLNGLCSRTPTRPLSSKASSMP